MTEINVTELRNHLHQYLSVAHNGSEILVTLHGQPIARILPPMDAQKAAVARLKELQKRCKIGDVVSPIDEQWEVEK